MKKRGFKSAILGGGAKTNAHFLKAGLVDELLLTIEPKIFGNGISLCEGLNLDKNLKDVVNNMPEGKLDWALTQVTNSIKKLKNESEKYGCVSL